MREKKCPPEGAAVGVDRTLRWPPPGYCFPGPPSGGQEAQYGVGPGPVGPEHLLHVTGVLGLHHARVQQALHGLADTALVNPEAQLLLQLGVVVRALARLDGLLGSVRLDDPIDDQVVQVVVGYDQLLLPCC